MNDKTELKKKPTIAELEAMLEDESYDEIKILPNGEIRAIKSSDKDEQISSLTSQLEDVKGERDRMREALEHLLKEVKKRAEPSRLVDSLDEFTPGDRALLDIIEQAISTEDK